MVKNYISTWLLFAGLLFSFNYSYSQSNHLVTFTGQPTDFNPEEKISGGDGVDYYVTFNETTLYFGAFRTGGGTFNPSDHFTIYLDTDPQPDLTSGTGSTTGMSWDALTPTFPFTANRRISIRNEGTGVSDRHRHSGSNWVQAGGTAPTQYATSNALEIAIDISTINNGTITTKGIYFSMYMSYNGGFFGYKDDNYPINLDGASNFTGYFGGIGITSEGAIPTDHFNTPILHSLIDENPVVNGKYAHMEFTYGFHTAPGNIELVAGGTAIITPTSALTVNGTFTNNGLITLQSWSTGYSSLIATAVDGNGKAQYHRHVNMNSPVGQNDLISAPLTGQTFGVFAAANPNILTHPEITTQKAFGIFNKDLGKYRNYYTDTNANTILEPGMGYRAASVIDLNSSSTGGAFTYMGTINTGEIPIPISMSTTGQFVQWNLIGNPYPSYIKIHDLLEQNMHLLHDDYLSIYAYVGGNTKVWEPIGTGFQSQNRVMAPGQGFFVLSNATGGNFTFKPEMRIASDTDDFIAGRMAAPIEAGGVSLRISAGSKSFYTDIVFQNGVTLDHDSGHDIALLDGPSFSVFSKLVEDTGNRNRELDVQALPYSILESEVSVPIGIKASKGEQLTISAINLSPTPFPLPETVEIYFEDAEAQTSTLLNTSTLPHSNHYIFTPSTNLTGEMGRFSLRFTNKSLSVSNPSFDALVVYSPLNTGNLMVRGNVNEVSSLEIFDLNGRLLQTFSVQPHQAENSFDISNLATGIYIVKLNNKTQSKIKKIQLNNKR